MTIVSLYQESWSPDFVHCFEARYVHHLQHGQLRSSSHWSLPKSWLVLWRQDEERRYSETNMSSCINPESATSRMTY